MRKEPSRRTEFPVHLLASLSPLSTCTLHTKSLSLALLPRPSQSLKPLVLQRTMSSAQQRLAAVSSSLSHPKGLLAGDVAIITGVSTSTTLSCSACSLRPVETAADSPLPPTSCNRPRRASVARARSCSPRRAPRSSSRTSTRPRPRRSSTRSSSSEVRPSPSEET